MEWIPDKFIEDNFDFAELRNELKESFSKDDIECPPKSMFNYKAESTKEGNTLLFMPAWDNRNFMGAKILTASPQNKVKNLPYLNGLYILFEAINGKPVALMDGKIISNLRTAATSVLASSLLSKKNPETVLILGNGNLAPPYIKAYSQLSGIKEIFLWGRDYEKSEKTIRGLLPISRVKVKPVRKYKPMVREMDIISCITSSRIPLIDYEDISHGQHFDLAGSYKEDMQEVSTDVVARCSVFTDNYDKTLETAGELVKAFAEGKLKKEEIRGDLVFLCQSRKAVRSNDIENTMFKCTGMATEDLVIARMIFNKYKRKNQNQNQ